MRNIGVSSLKSLIESICLNFSVCLKEGDFIITMLISLLVIDLIKYSVSPWFNLVGQMSWDESSHLLCIFQFGGI